MTRKYAWIDSPVGKLFLSRDEAGLRELRFARNLPPEHPADDWIEDRAAFEDVIAELRDYFAGERKRFEIALAPEGTPFQRKTWETLRRIPFGETITYSELARRVGNPRACRAVGAANGRNPLSIVIPCHRVVGSRGKLTGYAGGVDVKRRLLELEGGK